jgi:hypothetical protein
MKEKLEKTEKEKLKKTEKETTLQRSYKQTKREKT